MSAMPHKFDIAIHFLSFGYDEVVLVVSVIALRYIFLHGEKKEEI